jgi:hypothetical protein
MHQQTIGVAAALAFLIITSFLAEGSEPGPVPLAETEGGPLVFVTFELLLGL